MSAQVTITQLPTAGPITGTELVPVVQNGQTVQTTTGAISASPSQTQTFLTINQEPSLPNSQYLAAGSGLTLTSGGALSFYRIDLTGTVASLDSAGIGIVVKNTSSTVTPRSIAVSGAGLTVSNANGLAGNPTLSLAGAAASLANLGGTGMLAIIGGTTVTGVNILGTTDQVNVANGNGTGNPTISIANNPILPGTASVTLPTGTTAQRPAGVIGQIRYNSDINRFEGFQNSSWVSIGSGDGSVTSVNVSGGTTGLTTSGGPITTSGTITLGGTLALTNGGTGQTTAQGAMNTLAGAVTSGQYLRGDGSDVVMSAIQVADVPILNQNTTGQAGSVANSVTFNSTGGAAPGTTYNGSVARTIDYSTVGAPKTDGTGATGTWSINVTGSSSTATTATNLAGGAADRIAVQSGANTTTFIVAPTATDQFLKWTGSAFSWVTAPGVGTVTSVDVSGGTTGLTTSGGPVTTSGSITLAGTLVVANGGTGATTLTGYVKGNGTSAMTASATIPNTDITGLGTMSTQSASSVAITGGNINGTTIGGTTPAAGTFTSVAMTSGTITTTPTNGNDIVNKTYADSIAAGINFHQSVKYATTAALPAVTYNNGVSGVGATLTANANGALTIDGYTFTSPADNGTRILVKNQASQLQNGVYTLTQAGNSSPGAPFILTRATDFDSAGSGVDQIDAGDFFLVTAGTSNANTSWVQQTPLPITVGTTAIVFSQFGAPLVYSAGTGLTESPTYTFNIATTGVSAATYGSASAVPVIGVNAQGQITSAVSTNIAINGNQITSGTVGSSYISGSYTGITGVGTLTAGTWNATTIAVGYGGTGLTTYTNGDLIYASGATTLSKLGLGSSGQVLTAGASAPTYVDQSTLSVGSATNATNTTNISGGTANQIPVQTGAGATSFITAPTVTSTYLQWNGTAFVWTAAGIGSVTSVDVSGGTTGLTTSGGPVTTSGTITLAGTLSVANGGTGQTTYTDGQLLIGNSTGSTLTKATLTAGSGISITNGSGSITIAATGGGGGGGSNAFAWFIN